MGLRRIGEIELPAHVRPGRFDHAAIHAGRALLYVAHPANDAVEVVDLRSGLYLRSIPDLVEVSGLVSETLDLIVTTNRGEDTIAVLPPDAEAATTRIAVGRRPNGLAIDAGRGIALVAHLGDPSSRTGSVALVDAFATGE